MRAAEYTKRTVDVSRLPSGATGSHVLSYANTPGATEANALYDTPEQICAQLEAHRKAGVEYILLTMHGGKDQLRRFARDIMPMFTKRPALQSAEASDANAPV
jgi:alkanesulfonate monooxygenase SsuD/methylene tetrahydromethanopterin reductase-like flavin-dependent oxidoreductase (luciferase family)